jgi:transketolase
VPAALAGELKRLGNRIRLSAMTMTHHAQLGHTGGDLSAADILAVLYGSGVLTVDASQPLWPQRDRFILSKGHCAAALYSVLALHGFFPVEELRTFMDPLSRLNGHPDRNKVPGVEANTGPLGHGLPVAVGCALAARMKGEQWKTFVLTGDGELQEGSNWEAAMCAQHYSLDSLTVIIDRNGLQQGDFTENTIRLNPLVPKWQAFGFAVEEVDGHDTAALLDAFRRLPLEPGKPSCLVARTVKGKGVSFAENKPAWHHGVPSAQQLRQAAMELGEDAPW